MSISGKIAATGYNSVVSGQEIYDEICDEIEEKIYKAYHRGKLVYIGRAIELNNRGFRKRLTII